jgi:excisionase family DNA binding protein
METAEDRWLTRAEVAERLQLPVGTLADWASKGTGPRYARFGKHVRYRLSDVIAWENGQLTDQTTG